MKKLLSLFLLCLASTAFGQAAWYSAVLNNANSSAASGGGGANIASDGWETFEFDAAAGGVTVALLEANDGAPTGWATNGAIANMSISTSGEHATISTVNSTTDTGTRGLAISLAAGAAVKATYNIGTGQSSLAVSFWYKTGSPANFEGGPQILTLIDDANGDALRLLDGRDAGGNTWRGLAVQSGTIDHIAGLANATWYWIAVGFTTASATVTVYDTTGAQAGTVTVTGRYTPNKIEIGPDVAFTAQAATTVYFDDLVWKAGSSTILGP